MHDRLPDEVVQNIQQDRLLSSEDSYRAECSRRLHTIIDDPLLDGQSIERILGESQLRPTQEIIILRYGFLCIQDRIPAKR